MFLFFSRFVIRKQADNLRRAETVQTGEARSGTTGRYKTTLFFEGATQAFNTVLRNPEIVLHCRFKSMRGFYIKLHNRKLHYF